jgi:hypothetical protein
VSLSRKTLCLVYGFLGLLALAGTWANNLAYLHLGLVGANVRFWQETFANPASRSITVDILFLTLAAVVWMLLEARRLGMRWVWLYVVFGFLVAISFTFPLFLIHRERTLAAREPGAPAGALKPMDLVGLVILGGGSVWYALRTLIG